MKKSITFLITLAICAISFNSIAQTTGDDVGIESVLAPADGSTLAVNDSYDVTIVIKNYGTTTVTQIPVQYSVGTNSPLTGTCTSFIRAGDTAHYTFQNQLVVSSSFTGAGTVYTSLGTDVNSSNDQLNLNYIFGTTTIADPIDVLKFSVHNTPNQNTINLTLNKNNIKFELQIFDLVGKLVMNEALPQACTYKEINISELTKGTYIAKLESPKIVLTEKFIK